MYMYKSRCTHSIHRHYWPLRVTCTMRDLEESKWQDSLEGGSGGKFCHTRTCGTIYTPDYTMTRALHHTASACDRQSNRSIVGGQFKAGHRVMISVSPPLPLWRHRGGGWGEREFAPFANGVAFKWPTARRRELSFAVAPRKPILKYWCHRHHPKRFLYFHGFSRALASASQRD